LPTTAQLLQREAFRPSLRRLWNGSNNHSIAWEIADLLKVTVYAWKAGMFFDADPNTKAMKACYGPSCPILRADKPLFMIPWGGVETPLCEFKPNMPEPEGCGKPK
jgi:hypothetical protein